MIENDARGDDFDFYHEHWDAEEQEVEPVLSQLWRRPLLTAVAAVTALAMAIVPLSNVLGGRSVAENGLEVCGLDYCVVQEAVLGAGLDLAMSNLSNTFLDDGEARLLAGELTGHLGAGPVGLQVVEDLEGRHAGLYDPGTRSISIERPARAWTVVHEVAHIIESGHGPDFQDVVIELTTWLETRE